MTTTTSQRPMRLEPFAHSALLFCVLGRRPRLTAVNTDGQWYWAWSNHLTEDQDRFVHEWFDFYEDKRPFSLDTYRYLVSSGARSRLFTAAVMLPVCMLIIVSALLRAQ